MQVRIQSSGSTLEVGRDNGGLGKLKGFMLKVLMTCGWFTGNHWLRLIFYE